MGRRTLRREGDEVMRRITADHGGSRRIAADHLRRGGFARPGPCVIIVASHRPKPF
jgi:hypothetical protein